MKTITMQELIAMSLEPIKKWLRRRWIDTRINFKREEEESITANIAYASIRRTEIRAEIFNLMVKRGRI